MDFYERFLITISKEKIMNIIEYLCFNNIPCIKKSQFFANGLHENQELIEVDLTGFLVKYINYHHAVSGNRSIWLNNDSNFCLLLTEFLKPLINIRNGGKLIISYHNNYMSRTLNKEMIFLNDCLIFKENCKFHPENGKAIEFLLHSNKDLLDISNHEVIVSKTEFIKLFSNMPLFYFTLANTLRSSDQNIQLKQKKKGFLIQICIGKMEILRLRVSEKEGIEQSKEKNQNSQEKAENLVLFSLFSHI